MSSTDQQRIDEIRNNLYQIFDTKIDKEIIDLVFLQSGYKENVAFDHLQSMTEDVIETVPAPEPDPDPGPVLGPDPGPDLIPDPLLGAVAGAAAPSSPASSVGISDTTYAATNIDELTGSAMVLSIPYSSMEKTNDPFAMVQLSKTPPKKPVNLLEQLSSPRAPSPNDMAIAMSINTALNQDPAIIQAGPTSPARQYSLFPEPTSAPHSSPRPVPIPRPRPVSSYNPLATSDSLFTTNPYLSAPIYQEAPSEPRKAVEQYNLFMQPTSDGQVRRKDDTEKQIEYINLPTRRILILMRGLPGSGKSYRARQLCGQRGVILSTDDFFKRNAEGRYHFDPRFLHDAHMWNQDRARKSIDLGITPIFIDNTNMQKWEMKPYIDLANKKNYEVKIIEPCTPWAWKAGELARRNSHHVPKSKIENMMDRYERFDCLEDIVNATKTGKNPPPKSPPREGQAHGRPSPNKASTSNSNNNQPRAVISPIPKKNNAKKKTNIKNGSEVVTETRSAALLNPNSAPFNVEQSNVPYRQSPVKNLFGADPIGNSTILDVEGATNILESSQGNIPGVLRIDVSNQERILEDNDIDFNLLSINKDDKEATNSHGPPEEAGFPSPPVARIRNNMKIDLISPTINDQSRLSVYEVLDTPNDDEDENQSKTVIGNEKSVQSFSSSLNESENQNTTLVDEGAVVTNENESPGKIAELCKTSKKRTSLGDVNESEPVSNQNSGPDDKDTIDLTDDDKAPEASGSGAGASGELGKKEQFDLNLQFIYECFPDLKQSYCQDWLKRYNGDLVKTCDYLSRLSQVEELPDDPDDPDVEEIDPGQIPNKNDGFKDISDFTSASSSSIYKNDIGVIGDATPALIRDHEPRKPSTEVPPIDIITTSDKHHAETQTESVTGETQEPRMVGEAFYCDTSGSSTTEGAEKEQSFKIAFDLKLAKEMMKMFGDGNEEDQLRPEDLVLQLDNNMGKILFDVWMGSIKARKRKAKTMLEDDERYAKELQQEEDAARTAAGAGAGAEAAAATAAGVVNESTKKKKAKKDKKKDTPFSNDNDPRIYWGSFEPNHTWKEADTDVVSLHGKEKLNGRQISLRKQLYKLFPGVDEDALNEILAAASYNISSAETMIRNSCGLAKNQTIQNVYAEDVDGAEWSKVSSPPRKKVHTTPKNSPASPNNNNIINVRIPSPHIDNSLYQTMSEHNQSYQDFRAEAELHKNLRTEYFQKAAKAFQEKQGQVAQYYADKAREHTIKMNEAHGRAAELTLERKNREYMREGRVIDFHGLHSDEALRALTNFLTNAIRLRHKTVHIITGRGVHSKGSFSTVRNAVTKALTNHGYTYKYHNNGGMVEVFMK